MSSTKVDAKTARVAQASAVSGAAPVKYAKRARTAFIFFSKDNKTSIARASGLKRNTREFNQKVAETWKFLTPEQQAPYKQMAREDLQRFHRERETLPLPPRADQATATDEPRKPVSAWIMFLVERRDQIAADQTTSTIALTKTVAAEWRALSAEARQVYLDRAAEDRQRFVTECAAWQKAHPGKELTKSKAQQQRKAALKKPLSPWCAFLQERREGLRAELGAEASCSAISKRAAQEWKALSVEQKAAYSKAATDDHERYQKQMKEATKQKKPRGSQSSGKAKGPKKMPLKTQRG